jgi:hypothetical protein
MRAISERLPGSSRMRTIGAAMLTVLIAGCSTTPAPKPASSSPQTEQAWCASSCGPGYRCSAVRVEGILTGLCVAGPTQCTTDADCLKVSETPGTQPIRYICDKHSGGFPDKTGGAATGNIGTCMPGPKTGLENQ